MLLGDIHRNASQFASAQTAYAKAIAVKSSDQSQENDWPLYYVAGIAAEQAKDWPSAERYLKKALELNPNQPSVLNYLGYSWIDQGLDKAEAAEMIRLALAQRPNDPYITDSLAWVYYQQRQYPEAVKLLERALSMVANDPVITDHYADALWQVGRRYEARYQWQRALLFKPEDGLKAKIEQKLADGLTEDQGAKN
jgi:tetratricopeptide (TPR) repeat protein